MKKKTLKNLSIKKSVISNFKSNKLKGGTRTKPRTSPENPCSQTDTEFNN